MANPEANPKPICSSTPDYFQCLYHTENSHQYTELTIKSCKGLPSTWQQNLTDINLLRDSETFQIKLNSIIT